MYLTAFKCANHIKFAVILQHSLWPWKYFDNNTAAESVMPDSDSKLQDLVDYIHNWTVKNNMKLNVEKRNFPLLVIDNIMLDRVNSTREPSNT